ncbi:unnamed protein product [Orchesella dallaii]|uniref:Peptidase M20 dimerisation domain-containing protein n=1 Tax=Orchesella dallaii TaxID=48710 RepID=A0ABP1PQQ7_9HEXA
MSERNSKAKSGSVNPGSIAQVLDDDIPFKKDSDKDGQLFQTLEDEAIITDTAERPDFLNKIFGFIDENRTTYIETLREAVGIRSISTWPDARNECLRMVQWTASKLEELGFETELRKMGDQDMDGKSVPIPPIILATRGNDQYKKTLLIYGHLDVQPARQSDGWYTEPFCLTEDDGKLYGRGASDDKGPVLGWFHAIEAYIKCSIRIPINIKFVLETMLESGSEGLDDLMMNQKNQFLADVDLVAISDNYWLSRNQPCITYGLRGLCYFFVEVECGTKDLHSGVFGGAVREALPDLIWLLDQLMDVDGNILIPGIMDNVCPVLPEEEALYDGIEFDLEEFKADSGVKALRHPDDKRATLMARWRFPCLTIHGIQGAFGEPGAKTVIPRKVIGKFSIRLVPNQRPERIDKLVRDYLAQKWEERGSPNRFQSYMADDGLKPWCANPFHPSYKAARQATAWAYGRIPDMTREGGTLERLLLLQEITGKNVLLIPMGSCDDAAHTKNEKINMENYITGTKLFSAFIHEVGKLERAEL